MAWALVRGNNKIFRQHNRKYDLLKWGIETKEPISKRTIKNYKDGDKITVIFRKRYEKWFTCQSTGRYYKDWVEEVNEVVYTLREFTIQFTSQKKPIKQ